VLKNEYGGVSTTDRGFNVTPLRRAPVGIGETETNMLTPEQRDVLQVRSTGAELLSTSCSLLIWGLPPGM
jgi:hypothetical protein